MGKRFVVILALLVLTVCLISGGCKSPEELELMSWQDLLKVNPIEEIPPIDKDKDISELGEEEVKLDNEANRELISIDLYFLGPDGGKLVKETREIVKEEGLARKTIEELIKGPEKAENLEVFPEGTKLLDINIKPDGKCIIDFSGELTAISNAEQEKLIIYAIVNTLGQYAAINEVDFLINGNQVDKIAGFLDVKKPLEPDYNL
ncbi:MAG: GerMN domain-containing protein [Syntrophomonadaceae bacterium]|nr:GerMN domain-containing protein [Syntrophomonadaceae bacterium]